MPQAIVQRFKRRIKDLESEIEDLEAQAEALEVLRSLEHVYDALVFYRTQPHLSPKDQEAILTAMTILARGGGV